MRDLKFEAQLREQAQSDRQLETQRREQAERDLNLEAQRREQAEREKEAADHRVAALLKELRQLRDERGS